MYLINKTNLQDKIEISNPNDLHPTGKITNLEFVFYSIKPQSKRDNYFEQETLPDCDEKYWIYDIDTNQIIEMSVGEKMEVNVAENLLLKITENNWID